jgi:anti-sigma regulatory factor (Ser/Thr protein kinase)
MDYARPARSSSWLATSRRSSRARRRRFRDTSQIRIQSKLVSDVRVLADDVELGRVLQNLFENARRYGRSTETGIARVVVSYARTGPWVIITVRDHGQGVDPKKLDQLTTPFFRGDAARTAATGAGLGLAIVEKALARMGGAFEITNATDGGPARPHPSEARVVGGPLGPVCRRAVHGHRSRSSLLHQVLRGRSTLRIAQDQADQLRLSGSLSRPLTVPVDGDFINGQDFELQRASR